MQDVTTNGAATLVAVGEHSFAESTSSDSPLFIGAVRLHTNNPGATWTAAHLSYPTVNEAGDVLDYELTKIISMGSRFLAVGYSAALDDDE